MYSLRNWNHQISEHQGKNCITNRLIRVEECFQSLAFHFGFHQGIISANSYHICFFFRVFLFSWSFTNLSISEAPTDWKRKDVLAIVCFFAGTISSRYWEKGKHIIIDPFDFNVINGFINFKFWRFYHTRTLSVDLHNCIFRNSAHRHNLFSYIMLLPLFYILNKGLSLS